MSDKTVLVTGANGYIGNAVAKAFRRTGWKTFGLTRRSNSIFDLAGSEIHPLIGSPDDLSFLDQITNASFDVIVSNTEDLRNPVSHLEHVRVMLHEIAQRSQQAGKRPLVMFSSGCKDYGKMTEGDGDKGLAPHTEISPMNPPPMLVARTNFGLSLLEHDNGLYDATVLRPTCVYGNSSSHYGLLFDLAEKSQSALEIIGAPNAIMHSLDVDDCAEAYVSLAVYPKREEIAGQAFNLSNAKYDTAKEIGEALARSYGLKLNFTTPKAEVPLSLDVQSLFNYSQWVSSDRLRNLTGWKERKPTFVEGIEEYRLAYEASRHSADTLR